MAVLLVVRAPRKWKQTRIVFLPPKSQPTCKGQVDADESIALGNPPAESVVGQDVGSAGRTMEERFRSGHGRLVWIDSDADVRFSVVDVTPSVVERVEEVVRIADRSRRLTKGAVDEADPIIDAEQTRQRAGRRDPQRALLEPNETASAKQRPRDAEFAHAGPDVHHATNSLTLQPLRRSLRHDQRCPVLR